MLPSPVAGHKRETNYTMYQLPTHTKTENWSKLHLFVVRWPLMAYVAETDRKVIRKWHQKFELPVLSGRFRQMDIRECGKRFFLTQAHTWTSHKSMYAAAHNTHTHMLSTQHRNDGTDQPFAVAINASFFYSSETKYHHQLVSLVHGYFNGNCSNFWPCPALNLYCVLEAILEEKNDSDHGTTFNQSNSRTFIGWLIQHPHERNCTPITECDFESRWNYAKHTHTHTICLPLSVSRLTNFLRCTE